MLVVCKNKKKSRIFNQEGNQTKMCKNFLNDFWGCLVWRDLSMIKDDLDEGAKIMVSGYTPAILHDSDPKLPPLLK